MAGCWPGCRFKGKGPERFVETLILALLVGASTGLLLGLVGGGGSILTVPALIYLLGQRVGPATTISLAVVGLTAAFGSFQKYRRQRDSIRLDYALVLALLGLVGAQAGNWLNKTLPDKVTLGGFAVLMIAVAGLMLRPPKLGFVASEKLVHVRARWLRAGSIGLGLGFLTGLFGVGGGFLIVPALVLLLDFPMRYAAATSLVVIALNSLSALAGRWPLSGFDPYLAATLVVTGIAGTWAGNKFADRIPDKTLRKIFAWLVIGLGIYIGWQALK